MTKWHTVAVLATTMVCALLPAAAHASPSASSAVDVDPAVLHLMQADNLPRAEAEGRIAAQEKHNANAQRLADQLGPHRTAGAYLERETGELVVTVLDEAAAETVRATGARASLVTHSTAQLTAIMTEIATAHAKELESYFIDPILNAVVLRSSALTAGTLQRYGNAVRVAEPVGRPVQVQDVDAGFSLTTSPLPGGLEEHCTAGLSARDHFGINQFMITAKHCVGPNLALNVDGLGFGAAVLADPVRDSAAVANAFPTFWRMLPRIRAWEFGVKTVIGPPLGFVVVGTVVCKSGRTTRYTCGTVRANNVTTPDAAGQVEINACVEPGDSGGPVVAPAGATTVFAAGTTEGAVAYDQFGNLWMSSAQGRPFCGAKVGRPTITLYTPIAQTLQQFGMVLMTG